MRPLAGCGDGTLCARAPIARPRAMGSATGPAFSIHGPAMAHPIDFFVWPGDVRETTPLQVTLYRGFGIAHWNGNGLNFVAVPDVDPRDLERFARPFHSPCNGSSRIIRA
jgi:hypothetical protein